MIGSKISKSFLAASRSFGSRLHQPKELPRNISVDKIVRYFEQSSGAHEKTQKAVKMDIKNVQIVLHVLDKISDEFPNTKDFIKKELEEKCSKEGISEEEVLFFLASLITDESLCQGAGIRLDIGIYFITKIVFTHER